MTRVGRFPGGGEAAIDRLRNMALQAKTLTVSDSVARGEAEDRSASALRGYLESAGYEVTEQHVVADGIDMVAAALSDLCAGFAGLLVTTGGTGFGPRDLTPEGTTKAIERVAPGLSEAMRAVSPKGRLSRGVSGTIGACLILNTPGNPAGAIECLGAVIDVVPHALDLLSGGHPHPHPDYVKKDDHHEHDEHEHGHEHDEHGHDHEHHEHGHQH